MCICVCVVIYDVRMKKEINYIRKGRKYSQNFKQVRYVDDQTTKYHHKFK